MINLRHVNDSLYQIQEKPILHEQTIDELYKNHGLSHLEVLEGLLLADDSIKNKGYILTYIENKIAKAVKENELKEEAFELDLKTKRRQVKWFYPTLIAGMITGSIALLGQLGIVPIPKFEIWHKKDTTSTSLQTKKVYSTHIPTTSVQGGKNSK